MSEKSIDQKVKDIIDGLTKNACKSEGRKVRHRTADCIMNGAEQG